MANGGWYGTSEEWEHLEAPLLQLDPTISSFVGEHSLALSKNQKDWPERSLRWGQNPSCLMQLYLADADAHTWHLWLCCTEDRGRDRFWRQERLIDGEQIPTFAPRILGLLKEVDWRIGRPHLINWSSPRSWSRSPTAERPQWVGRRHQTRPTTDRINPAPRLALSPRRA